MNFELDAPYLEIQRQARDFARAIEPVAAQADEMFSVLMGEDVESRRNFIQQNARDVRFLDI